MKEIWKDIEGYENKYQISNLGRIKSIKKDLIMKPMTATNGYLVACLWKNNKQKKILIHRLVAKAFIKNKNNYTDINHKDEDKTNNVVSNLEWCTHKYNMNYGNVRQKISIKAKNRKMSEDLRQKYSEASKDRKWVHNYKTEKLIKNYNLAQFLEENQNWAIGRKVGERA